MEWQPIETAPKDGTSVLVFNGLDVSVGYWFIWEHFFTGDRLSGFVKNWNNEFGCPDSFVGDATHWMPLPPPPSP